jgi:hypothetical protein
VAKEYEIYVPLNYNDGSPIEFGKIKRVGKRLLKCFEGFTFFPQPNLGTWKMGNVVFHDEIVIFRTLTPNVEMARRFLRKLKEQLKRELRQEEILIVEKDAEIL